MEENSMQKITPFLWFDHQAEDAMNFYVSVFRKSKIVSINRYGDTGPGPKGSVMIVKSLIEGQEFIAINGGPQFQFSQAVSFVVNCKTQEEVDEFWESSPKAGKNSNAAG